MQFLKQRLLAVLLILGSIAMIYYGWYSLRVDGVYYLKMAAFAPLIGVGGIFTGDDLYEKIALGAHLCQVYTGWIYGGPQMAPMALQGLCDRLTLEGMTLSALRGSKA